MGAITAFDLVKQPKGLHGGMLIGGRPAQTRGQLFDGGEKEPFVFPTAVGLLVGNYPFDPAPPDFLRKARFENKRGFLNIEVNHCNIEPLRSANPVAKMFDKRVEFVVGALRPAKMHQGPELVGEFSLLPVFRVKEPDLLRRYVCAFGRDCVQDPLVVNLLLLEGLIQS